MSGRGKSVGMHRLPLQQSTASQLCRLFPAEEYKQAQAGRGALACLCDDGLLLDLLHSVPVDAPVCLLGILYIVAVLEGPTRRSSIRAADGKPWER